MEEFEITSINKPNRMSQHEHITHIGNTVGNWRMTRETAIAGIEAKRWSFYTIDKTTNRKMYIAVIRELGKHPFLRTHADGKWNDNLLALPECPINLKLVA